MSWGPQNPCIPSLQTPSALWKKDEGAYQLRIGYSEEGGALPTKKEMQDE